MARWIRLRSLGLSALAAAALSCPVQAAPVLLGEWTWTEPGQRFRAELKLSGGYRLTAQWQPGTPMYFENRVDQGYWFCLNYLPDYNTFGLCFSSATSYGLYGSSVTGHLSWEFPLQVGMYDQGVPYTQGYSVYGFDPALLIMRPEWYSYEAPPVVSFRLEQMYTVVPESATWVLMLVGFGFAGAAYRARRTGEMSDPVLTLRARQTGHHI